MADAPTRTAAREAFDRALLADDPAELYEQAPCGYLSLDVVGRIVKANRTFLTWTGYVVSDLTQQSFVELLTSGSRMFYETHVRPSLHMTGQIREIALDVTRADGTVLPVLLNAVLSEADRGGAAAVRIAVFDATERRRYEHELLDAKRRAEASEANAVKLAQTLQATMIPPHSPEIPGLEVAARYRPAGDGEEVGGDFYDIFQISTGDWAIVMGDVAGKGVEAAVVTAFMRHSVRALVVSTPSPRKTMALLNTLLLEHPTQRFCTIVLLRLRRTPRGWDVTSVRGGHPPPLLFRADGSVEEVGEPGSLVGALEVVHYTDTVSHVDPGDTIVLYTDGVTEGRQGGTFYGEVRLRDRVQDGDMSPDALVDRVLSDVLDFQSNRPRDDIALLALRVPADSQASMASESTS
ncbi:MAG: SpoIIE family protein phosphatase [Nocardioides sp.]